MPANAQKPAAPSPASPRNTSKYTNKDGSKFITVPKGSSDSSQPPTPTAPATNDRKNRAPHQPAASSAAAAAAEDDDDDDDDDVPGTAPTVNRKKQKRRQKAAAKAAAEKSLNGHAPAPVSTPLSAHNHTHSHAHEYAHARRHAASVPPPPPQDTDFVATDDEEDPQLRTGRANGEPSKSKKNRKKKKKAVAADADAGADLSPAPPRPQPARGSGMSRDKIWSTSNHEERERIKEFWLGLGEDERKSLVKVEKDAVLRKMKEQQKHTCSCTVCGRKRTAIEEELEGLYDAYYLELEQFANQGEGPPMLPSPRDFPLRPPRGLPTAYAGHPPSRGRIVEHVGDDEDEEEEIEEVYSEEEVDDDEYSDEEPPEAFPSAHERDVADFLTFGNSLQVKGGILTVADDLLKNDGKRFIEMMEQLAERRMAREEDAREHFSRGFAHPNGAYAVPHNHPPPEEEEYEDEEDEEDEYEDSQDDEYEDEEDQMTEAQRMEEGRRMFQIFAARMFEQRVLSAYKEKVAKERQQKLLEELEEESRHEHEQKAKKAKNAQKKKDKAAQRKQALAEEKARKDAEKAAEDAARIEAEQKRAAEQKHKAEEKRRLKEAQRKAEEEARLKKEAERLRKIHEQKEKQAEQERKAREAKEREKKAKEEQRIKDKEAREQKEREAQERKEKQERDKKDKEARAVKAQREAQEATEAKARAKAAAAAGLVQPQIQVAKRGQQLQPALIPATAVLPHHPPNPANFASPKITVATPALPKTVPTPARPRAPSQQHDAAFSTVPGPSPTPSPRSTAVAAHMSPGSIGQERKSSFGAGSGVPYPVSSPGIPPSSSSMLSAAFHGSPVGMQPPPGLPHHGPPGFPSRLPNEPVFPGFRPSPGGMMMPPPGINGPAGRGMPSNGPIGPPGFSQPIGEPFPPVGQGYGLPKDALPQAHNRQGSGAFDAAGAVAMPIGRPAPIGRPGSTSRGRFNDDGDEAKRLGSSVLVEDDEPFGPELNTGSLRTQPPGQRPPVFGTSPFMDGGFPRGGHSLWAPPPPPPPPPTTNGQHFPPPGFGNPPGWGAPPPPGMPQGFSVGSPGGGLGGGMRSMSQPSRHIAVRQMLCSACKFLAPAEGTDGGFVDVSLILGHIENETGDTTVSPDELLNLCDTEGNATNGGGTFEVGQDPVHGHPAIRWTPNPQDKMSGGGGISAGVNGSGIGGAGGAFRPALGEIGSPLTGFSSPSSTMRGL